jgi:predicted ribonuclease YlaK
MSKKNKNSHELFFGITCNEDQEKYKEAILDDNNQVIIVDATAGSGKTLIAVACAKQLVSYADYDGAIFVFPVNQESELGYRPGDTQMKESDYLEPLYDALEAIDEVPSRVISSDITEKNGTAWITARSATFMRGINLKKKVLIIDECQNMTVPDIKKIVSRAHDNCKVIICGCLAQTDIPISKSGFKELIEHMKGYRKCVQCELPISYRGELAMWIDKL